ncbi:MAG: hypothetical protein M0Z47_01395 [Actinomycetota bacterium]|nr:hypothetical protein [Actinomycetota bacterium]
MSAARRPARKLVRSRRYRLARSAVVFVALVAVISLLVAEGFSGNRGSSATGSSTQPSTTTTAPPPTFVVPGSAKGASLYQAASYSTTYSEPGTSMCVPSGSGQSCGPRVLRIGAFYPAMTSGSSPVPYRGYYRMPLVMFAPGYDLDYSNYMPVIQALTKAGYVVVGVDFPRTSPPPFGGLDEADILNQPADVSAAITWALTANTDPSSPLYELIDPSEIAITGQSDGGDTVLATAYNTCCRDSRPKAVVVFSGAELATYRGSYFPAGLSVPMLVVQGSADTINPPAASQQIYTQAPSPKYLLWLQGAGHLDAYTEPSSYEAVVAAVTVDFLNGYLKGDSQALASIAQAGNVTGVSTFQSG